MFSMELLPMVFIRLLFLAVFPVLTHGLCVSRASSQNIDTQCQKFCALGKCLHFCLCTYSNATDTCANLDFASNDKLAINETVRPGTPIFTIQVDGQERWTYTLARQGPVDGSVWSSLSKYLKLTKIGNQYEMIVDITPDLEYIFQTYGIKLESLTLILTCERNGLPNLLRQIILQILPVNEHAPEFFVTPLTTTVPENTKADTEVYLLSDHTIDADVSLTDNELLTFGIWEYLPDVQRDGRLYFQISDTLTGSIHVMVELDYEELKKLDALRLFLNVSASDMHSVTSYTVLTVDVTDVDDLPPEFYHPSCMLKSNQSWPCVVSYEATLPLNFLGQITNITPGVIQAKDMDSLNVPVKYSLKQGPGETLDIIKKFTINETTGSLSVLSPFQEESIIQLVIEAREISRNARSVQTSLHIKTGDTVATVPGTLDSSHRSGSSISSSSTQFDVEVFKLATIILSLCVLLLVLTSIILCAKLKTGTKRTATVKPADIPKILSDTSNDRNFTDNKKFEPKLISMFAASSVSTSYGHDKDKPEAESESLDLSNDRNQQNISSDQAPFMCFLPPLTCNSNNVRQNQNAHISSSALSSYEIEKMISLTLSNRPNTGGDQYGRYALSNYPETGRSRIWKQNLLTVSDDPYTESDTQPESNILIISSLPEMDNNSQRYNNVRGYQEFMSVINNGKAIVHKRSHNDSESVCSVQTRTLNIQNSNREVNNTNMVKNEISAIDDIPIIIGSDKKDRYFHCRNKQVQLNERRREYLRDSSDDCNDKESDDGYNNDNSISEASTVSYSGSKSVILPQPCRDNMCNIPSDRSLKGREDDSELKRTSASFISNRNRKTPRLSVKESVHTEVSEHTEGLSSNDPGLDNDEKETKSEQHNDLSVHAQKTKSVSEMHSLNAQTTDKEQTPDKNADNAASCFCVTSDKTQDKTNHNMKYRQASKTLSKNAIRTSLASSLSTNETSNKRIGNVDISREQNSEEVCDSSSSFSRERLAAIQIRPHTSDETKRSNKAFRSELIDRPTTSAPSRLKRRIRKRKTYDQENFHEANYVEEFLEERPTIVFQNGCRDLQYYDSIEGNLEHRYRHLHPRSLSHYIVPDQNSLDPGEINRHGYHLGNAHYWQPGYEKVYINRSLQGSQILHHLPQQCQRNHGGHQQQRHRLYSVPEVPDLRLHHPNDHHHYERSMEMTTPKRKSKPERKTKSHEIDVEENNNEQNDTG